MRRAGLLLKAVVFALILLALGEPRLAVLERRVAVGVLADVSASVPAEQMEQERELARQIEIGAGQESCSRPIAFDESTHAGASGMRPMRANG